MTVHRLNILEGPTTAKLLESLTIPTRRVYFRCGHPEYTPLRCHVKWIGRVDNAPGSVLLRASFAGNFRGPYGKVWAKYNPKKKSGQLSLWLRPPFDEIYGEAFARVAIKT